MSDALTPKRILQFNQIATVAQAMKTDFRFHKRNFTFLCPEWLLGVAARDDHGARIRREIMSDFICYICGGEKCQRRNGKVRDDETLYPVECVGCGHVVLRPDGYMTTDYFERYAPTGGDVDQTLLGDVILKDQIRRFHDFYQHIVDKDILDFGCGRGAFLKLAATVAKNGVGLEINQPLRQRLIDEKCQVVGSLKELPKKGMFDTITMFLVLGHLPDPLPVLGELSRYLKPNTGRLIIEVQNANDALLTLYESAKFAEFTYASESPFVFSQQSLRLLMEKAGFTAMEIRQYQRYPLSNHLYWLAKGKPGGQKYWPELSFQPLADLYSAQLAALGKCDTLLGEFTVL